MYLDFQFMFCMVLSYICHTCIIPWTSADQINGVRSTHDVLKMSTEKTTVVENITRWTGFEGCANFDNPSNFDEATNTRVVQFFNDFFNDGLNYRKNVTNIVECSIYCGMNIEVTNFTFYKGTCQCIDTLHNYSKIGLDPENMTCINTSRCIEFYDGFCASGEGLPFYAIKTSKKLAFKNYSNMDIARVNLLPTQCAVQVNNTHLQSYSEDECKKKMRIHPCEEGRIIFKIKSVGVLEWICVIENGISKRYFKTSTMHTEDDKPSTIVSNITTVVISQPLNNTVTMDTYTDGILIFNASMLLSLLMIGVAFLVRKIGSTNNDCWRLQGCQRKTEYVSTNSSYMYDRIDTLPGIPAGTPNVTNQMYNTTTV